MERYEELNACKLKYEKISIYKNKIEEIHQAKEKEKQLSNKPSTNTASGLPPRIRVKKKDNTYLKNYKNIFKKTQEKDEMDRQKKDIKHTLEAVLDTKSKFKVCYITTSLIKYINIYFNQYI